MLAGVLGFTEKWGQRALETEWSHGDANCTEKDKSRDHVCEYPNRTEWKCCKDSEQ